MDASWTTASVAEHLNQFLIHTIVDEDEAEKQAAQVRRVATQARAAGNSEHEIEQAVVGEAMRLLLERVYQYVLNMRYQMLRNEIEYARPLTDAAQSQPCRRVIVRNILDNAAHVTQDNYQCGFCDVCQPDLRFTVTSAVVPAEDARADDLPRRLVEAYRQFDRAEMEAIPRIAADSGRLLGLLARVTNYLEGDPVNLSALYLAGALARRREGRERESLRYLAFGFEEGIRQGLPPDDLLLFYQEAALVAPDEAFAWISRRGGPWDTPDGLSFLIQRAGGVFPDSAPQLQGLRALHRMRALQQRTAQLVALAPATGVLAAHLHARDDGA